jgi:hypothetical protein
MHGLGVARDIICTLVLIPEFSPLIVTVTWGLLAPRDCGSYKYIGHEVNNSIYEIPLWHLILQHWPAGGTLKYMNPRHVIFTLF